LSAPKRSRRVTTSRTIHLIDKKQDAEGLWTLFKVSIFFLFSRYWRVAEDVCLDEDGMLESFTCLSAMA
jgi:hypothetical protein